MPSFLWPVVDFPLAVHWLGFSVQTEVKERRLQLLISIGKLIPSTPASLCQVSNSRCEWVLWSRVKKKQSIWNFYDGRRHQSPPLIMVRMALEPLLCQSALSGWFPVSWWGKPLDTTGLFYHRYVRAWHWCCCFFTYYMFIHHSVFSHYSSLSLSKFILFI